MRLLTLDLPGTSGMLKSVPEDFLVEEIPAYAPAGEGPHTFLFVEKRGLNSEEALTAICRALGVPRNEAGLAGAKDRQAVTRQWMSLPNVDPARALALSLENLRVLEARRHGKKLRTGHLRGNRFTLVVRGTTDGVGRARAVLAALSAGGVANYFGAQRFGNRGDNAARGRDLLLGKVRRGLARSERRLYLSAYQSELFNRYLDRRIDDGLHVAPLLGDILKKRDTGGLFTAGEADLEASRARLHAGELVVTGPMFGHRMMAPPEGSPAAARESAILAEEGLTPASFAGLGGLGDGTRRPLLVPLDGASAEPGEAPDSVVLRFALPAGSYATCVLGEVMKGSV
jgi:tRNA pseudouridine13 synthase